MEHRARTRPNLCRAGLLAALVALLVPAVAGPANADAAKRKQKRSPVVTSISPTKAFVGETLTIRGRNFRRGVNRNTVAFKRAGAKVVFVKAEKGTRTLLKVTLAKRLERSLVVRNGTPVPTRLKVRVLAKRFGKRFTRAKLSPVIGPEKPPAPPVPPVADPDADCDGDGAPNRLDGDDDNDLLSDAAEAALKLNACSADTDGDGVGDGYEWASARDLNDGEHQSPNRYLPYPEKRPYPNALDGTDANTDHDGDSLTLKEEYDLWKYTIARGSTRTLATLTYSAGEQYSVTRAGGTGHRTPSLAASGYAKQQEFLGWASATGYASVALADVGTIAGDDTSKDWWAPRTAYTIRDIDRDGSVSGPEATYYDDGNGWLDDGERDEDADGLSNFDETRGCMNRGRWDSLYDRETAYPLQYPGTRLDDPDTDGDGIRDGADDQDNDDVPNLMECSRVRASALAPDPPNATTPRPGLPAKGFVNPFNPCLPHDRSRTCKRYVALDDPWAPFNADDVYYLIRN